MLKKSNGGTLFSTNPVDFWDRCVITDMAINNSVGGFIFNIRIPQDRDYIIDINSSNFFDNFTYVHNFILKVALIHNRLQKDEVNLVIPGYGGVRKEIITPNIFNTECNIQTQIFNQTNDMLFEPVCPRIIYKQLFDTVLTGIPPSLRQGLDGNPTFTQIKNHMQQMQQMQRIGRIQYGIGLIIMEKMNNSRTISERIPLPNPGIPFVPTNLYDRNRDFDHQRPEFYLYSSFVYQLIRMVNECGYIHSDFHNGNALFNEHYAFIGNFRTILIDFGRVKQTGARITTNSDLKILFSDFIVFNDNDLYFNLPQERIRWVNHSISLQWWSYRLLMSFIANIIIYSGVNYVRWLENNRNVSKNGFINRLKQPI